MFENIQSTIGIIIILIVQVSHLIKNLTDNKVIKTEIKNLVKDVKRQNGRIEKTEDRLIEHIESHK